jgi:hypothetical protein
MVMADLDTADRKKLGSRQIAYVDKEGAGATKDPGRRAPPQDRSLR